MPLALALAAVLGLGLGWASSARAQGLPFQHTIPRSVAAYDYTTGGQYKAPPVPYGHYAKDYIPDFKGLGCVSCRLHALAGGGGPGHGLFHHGQGDGNCGGDGCGDGNGCGHGSHRGMGIFGHHAGSPCDVAGCGGGIDCGLLGHGGYDSGGAGYACTVAQPSGQVVAQASAQSACAQTGCKIKSRHSHKGHPASAIDCGPYGGEGTSGLCGDAGCGRGHGHGHGQGTGCGFCGGKGCSNCLSALNSRLGSHLHGKLASLTGALHKPKTSWFLGAGGPVPLTPGYVPYVVTTRSPREFFAFAPMNPND